ncbi:MAG: hypothetical protein ACFB0C_20320 [Leptolyngbyaceae cyanobacterium]
MATHDRFAEFPKPVRDNLKTLLSAMNGFQDKISQLSKDLDSNRDEYKLHINQFFEETPPFPTHGKIEDDIETYIKIVGYCLDLGDTELLDKWGICEISASPSETLASDDYELYLLTFNSARMNSQTPLEEKCFEKIANLFSGF